MNKVEDLDGDDFMPNEDLYVLRAFGSDGWLSKTLPGYAMREGQFRLAQKIDTVFKHSRDLVAEGPTGIGKSLAYLVPLAYRTSKHRRRGLIVTANIALQEQLINKDLPLLQKALPWGFGFALHKGRNNYLCKDAAKNLLEKEKDGRHRLHILDEKEGHNQHDRIAAWAAGTETGDVSDLPFEPLPKVWSRFSVTSEECAKGYCPSNNSCWANSAFGKLGNAQIVVTNYHIFFGQLQGEHLFDYDYVIFDEAHKAADIARDFYGFKITPYTFRWLANRLNNEPHLKKQVEQHSANFFLELEQHYRSSDYRTRIKDRSVFRTIALGGALLQIERIFDARTNKYAELVKKADADAACSNEEKFKLKRGLFDAVRATSLTKRLQANLESAAKLDEDYVYYLEEDRDQLALKAKKLDISKELENGLWGGDLEGKRLGDRAAQSLVLLSATMSVGGSFEHIMKDLGITGVNTDLFAAESPFDWRRQAIVIVPEDFPDPKDDVFRIKVGQALGYIVEQARGRTLGLFTSWVGLNTAYELLKPRCKYRILKQGDMPRGKLIEEFKKDQSSVLLGVESFWQGIDVPGDSLACLVIDKLPFPSLEDPILDALQERWDAVGAPMNHPRSPFDSYSVPRMVLSLKQGFGRLIRTTSDRGVVVILDRRVHTAYQRYGKVLLNSLPPTPQSVDLDDVGRFLK